jgi:hypothetical protein
MSRTVIFTSCLLIAGLLVFVENVQSAEPEASPKPVLKITPGKVIVPTDAMRRPWGELVSLDLKTRTGKFRKDGTDEIISFTVLPYAELLHHATFGDLQDFRVGERAIFRLHQNEQGEWVWLTYIQDEMNFLNGHKEYYYVDKIDTSNGRLECTDANADRSFVRKQGIAIDTDSNTRYWRAGQPASFADIKVGDKLRTKTHGTGRGDVRVCWEVFLDDESLLRFQAEQKQVHAARMQAEGLPGYIDSFSDGVLQLTLFREAGEQTGKLKVGQSVRVASAGVDRRPTAEPVAGTIHAVKGPQVSVMIPNTSAGFIPTNLARLWSTAE